jgi:putative OmpL-like beta-barrel porin-2
MKQLLIFSLALCLAAVAVAGEERGTPPTAAEQAPATPTPSAPLMNLLDQAGVGKPLRDLGLNLYGYVEGGYFYDFSAPHHEDGPTFMGYNKFKNSFILDNISLNLERAVDPTKRQFDIGFRVEGLYGADAAFIHSNGMFDDQTGRNQWDLLQAWVDVTLPGIPMRIRAGKWIELAGFENYSANIYNAFGDPARNFYSHSYSFLYAEPGTQTGVLFTYVYSPKWTFEAGFTRGWNQSTRDANNTLDFLGRIIWAPSDKTAVTFVMTEGPEFPIGVGPNQPPGDNGHWWTYLDLVVTQKITDQFSAGVGIDFVNAPEIPGLSGGAKQWGAVDGYLSYAVDPHFTLNTRLEWYRDAANGFSYGGPVSANFYSASFGVAIKPFPENAFLSHLLFRPEIRYDHSSRAVFDNGDKDQVMFSADALFTF